MGAPRAGFVTESFTRDVYLPVRAYVPASDAGRRAARRLHDAPLQARGRPSRWGRAPGSGAPVGPPVGGDVQTHPGHLPMTARLRPAARAIGAGSAATASGSCRAALAITPIIRRVVAVDVPPAEMRGS